jgi:glycogen operon protein
MILGGDELSRTKNGNNNTYCHDNELNWYDWTVNAEKSEFLKFVKRMIALKLKQPVLHRRKFFAGKNTKYNIKDVTWFHPNGNEMEPHQWHEQRGTLAYVLEGTAIDELDQYGERILGDTLLVVINASSDEAVFALPYHRTAKPWRMMLSSSRREKPVIGHLWHGGNQFSAEGKSLALFQLHFPKDVSWM